MYACMYVTGTHASSLATFYTHGLYSSGQNGCLSHVSNHDAESELPRLQQMLKMDCPALHPPLDLTLILVDTNTLEPTNLINLPSTICKCPQNKQRSKQEIQNKLRTPSCQRLTKVTVDPVPMQMVNTRTNLSTVLQEIQLFHDF